MRFCTIIALCIIGINFLFQTASAQLHDISLVSEGEDLGGTWTKSEQGNGWNWYDIAISSSGKNQTAVISSPISKLYLSTDHGESWKESSLPEFVTGTNVFYQAVAMSSTGQYIATAVALGPIYVSRDYGVTWNNVTGHTANALPASVQWQDVTMSATGQVMGAVVAGGFLYYSIDFGATWSKGSSSVVNEQWYYSWIEERYFSISVSDSGKYWVAVCGDGNGRYQTAGTVYYGELDVSGVLFLDPATMTGVKVGSSQMWVGAAISGDGRNVTVTNSITQGGVYQSTDYGHTFYKSTTAPNITSFDNVAMSTDGQTQIITTLNSLKGVIYLTNNGGQSWNVSSIPGGWMNIAVDSGGDFMAATNIGVGVYSYLPNCPYGQVHTGFDAQDVNGCVPCEAGSYEEYFGAPTCTECAESSYSTTSGNFGESTCRDCVYPWSTMGSGDTSCPVLWLNAGLAIILPLCGVLLALLTLIFLFGNDNQLTVLIIMGFPALDVLTDLTYLLISRFYSLPIFILCLLFFLHPAPMFMYKLYKYQAWPYALRYIWWIGASSTNSASAKLHGADSPAHAANQGDHIPFPTILGRRFTLLISFDHHDNLYVMVLELLTWIVAVAAQGLTLVLLPMFLVFWLCVGVFLQMTKTIAMGTVWNNWFYVWTGYTHWSDEPGTVDTEDLNYGLLTQFCLETVPHIILQSVNNTLLGTWVSDPIAIFSLVMSVFMAVATIYKYLYHVGIRADRQEMRDVPLDKSVTVKMMCSDIEYTILNAKLAPHSRNILVPTAEQLKYEDHRYAQAGTAPPEGEVNNPISGSRPSSTRQSLVPPVNVVGGDDSAMSGRLSLNSSFNEPVRASDEEQPQMAYAEAVFMPVPVLFSSHSASAHSSGKMTPTAPLIPPPPAAFRPQISVPYVPPQMTVSTSSSALMSLALPSPSARSGAPSPVTAPAVLGASPAPSDYPPELICPLSRRLMTDPVICADGYTYERAAIEQHFRSQKELLAQIGHAGAPATSPITKESLDTEQLFPNRALAALLAKYNGF